MKVASMLNPTDVDLANHVRRMVRGIDAGILNSGTTLRINGQWYLLTVSPSAMRDYPDLWPEEHP